MKDHVLIKAQRIQFLQYGFVIVQLPRCKVVLLRHICCGKMGKDTLYMEVRQFRDTIHGPSRICRILLSEDTCTGHPGIQLDVDIYGFSGKTRCIVQLYGVFLIDDTLRQVIGGQSRSELCRRPA